MKRRRLLRAVAGAASAGAVAGCVSLGGGGGDGGSGNGGTTETMDVPENFGLQLCPNDDTAIYRIADPSFTVGSDQTTVTGTIEYIGEDTSDFSVVVDLLVSYFDEDGEKIRDVPRTLRFAPDKTFEWELTLTPTKEKRWDQVSAITVQVRDSTAGGGGEDGCLAEDDADPASGG